VTLESLTKQKSEKTYEVIPEVIRAHLCGDPVGRVRLGLCGQIIAAAAPAASSGTGQT
jgi:hypothetical protein